MKSHLSALLMALAVSACAPAATPAPTALPTAAPPMRMTAAMPIPATTAMPIQITAQVAVPASVSPTPAVPPAASGPLPAVQLQVVAQGLNRPLALVSAPGEAARLWVVEQPGVIRVLDNGQVSATPFLDIRDRVNSRSNEQGLLGLAFHPQFASNGLFFVNYINAQGSTVVARFATLTGDPTRADPASEQIILQVEQPYANHNGGGLAFGPEGYLYVGLGDGGSRDDPLNAGQRLDTLLGKFLRLEVSSAAAPYAIPADNPFVNVAGARPEIWAYGIRNPWGFAFDPLTGDLWFADVGQNQREEINRQPAGVGGLNYGWRYFEGDQAYLGQPPAGQTLVPPVAAYGRDEGCSVTGGLLYRGAAWPALFGRYLFSDYCTGTVWVLTPGGDGWTRATLTATGVRVSALSTDAAGQVYVLDHGGGRIYRLAAP